LKASLFDSLTLLAFEYRTLSIVCLPLVGFYVLKICLH